MIKNPALHSEILKKFAFFASFSTEQLEEIASLAPRISLKENTVVFSQGDRSATMYLILKGAVKIEREDAEGETISVAQMSVNQVFGELAMLSEEPRQATVTVTEDAEFLVIDRNMMLDIIRKAKPEEILEVFSVLSEQMRAANDREFKDALSRRTLEAQMEVEKQRALTQMVAGVAHEINTPLGIINTAVSIMARELAEPVEVTTQRAADIAESLELMRRNVERAHRLVQDFKKVSVSQLTDKKEAIDISEVIEETVGLIMVSLKRSQIHVEYKNHLTVGQNKWIGYRGFLSQILINLLTNVERYAYPHNVGGNVDIIVQMENDKQYRLVVKDYGKGISRENQARVFEPFFTTGRPIGGTGLGLSIVYNLVKNALKGDIKLKSAEGKGTEFIVTFPQVIPD
ncbi:MAG: cyclic nucleotide-binding domain-containing protein [Chloroflexi bacterium]|nr:cyclic nucleotide-binding domain-containing protein [Chloroflexota bacterium]